MLLFFFFFSSRRRHTRCSRDWSSDVCSSDLLWRLVGSTDRMDLAYAAADLAVCRAGAATLFEIASAALPAIVVPYPYATADHQRANAQPLVDSKAVVLLLDADCTPGSVGELVDDLLPDESRLGAM